MWEAVPPGELLVTRVFLSDTGILRDRALQSAYRKQCFGISAFDRKDLYDAREVLTGRVSLLHPMITIESDVRCEFWVYSVQATQAGLAF